MSDCTLCNEAVVLQSNTQDKPKTCVSPRLLPGQYVRHRLDDSRYGTVMSATVGMVTVHWQWTGTFGVFSNDEISGVKDLVLLTDAEVVEAVLAGQL